MHQSDLSISQHFQREQPSAVRDRGVALTCALRGQPPFHLTPLFVLDVVRVRNQRLPTVPEQNEHEHDGAQMLGHPSV